MTRWIPADCECCGRKGGAMVLAGEHKWPQGAKDTVFVRCDACRYQCSGRSFSCYVANARKAALA